MTETPPSSSTMDRTGTDADADMGSRGQGQIQDDAPADPRQLVFPHVDAAVDLSGGRLPVKLTAMTVVAALPALLVASGAVWGFATGRLLLGMALLAGSVVLAGLVVTGRVTASWAAHPHEMVLDGVAHLRRRVTLPWGYADAVANAEALHGIEATLTVDVGPESDPWTYAGVLTAEGRAVVPVRLHGENTEFLDPGELDTLSGTLTQGFDTEISPGGGPIALYSTTRPATSAVATEYLDRAEDLARGHASRGGRAPAYVAGLLGDLGEWVGKRDAETGANEVANYVIVEASSESDRQEVGDALRERIHEAERAIGSADSLSAAPADTREVLDLAAEYWARAPHPDTPTGEAAAEAAVPPVPIDDLAERPRDGEGATDAARAISPEWYAERTRHVEVGDMVARTFWISTWPEQPRSRFLHTVRTMPGVDLDLKLYAHPRDREAEVNRLEKIIPRIDAEGMDRAAQMDVGSLTLDDNLSYYILAYKLLQTVDTQPWGLSGYVTVRAPDEERLREAADRVRTALQKPPARCDPAAPFGDQHTAFRSAAPFGADRLAERGAAHQRATKTHRALGGVLGAALPAATFERRDPGGIRWGRDVTTGRTVQVDPFSQGKAPHLVTVGPSGSGKTFAVEAAAEEWWANGDDRTVIFADTQGGFEDAVEAFAAEHVVIDGKTGINPLDIRPAADHDQAATGGRYDQYRLKVEEATEFFAGIIRSNGVDPADYTALIEQAVEQTYADAGITTDPATHGKPSPDPTDLFAVLEDMVAAPADYTFTAEEREAGSLAETVADLLAELSAFKPGGKHHNLLQDTSAGLSPETEMAYLDLRQLAGDTGGAQSVTLQLAVGQVSQLIKQTEGETIFVIDEAHNLLHSEQMTAWLNKAAREWRRYDAALWFVTQSPQEFLQAAEQGENKRATIVEQCSTIQIMRADGVDASTLAGFGLPETHARTVRKRLVPGSAAKGYSECILSFQSERGWIRTRVETSPLLAESITFSHRAAGGRSYQEIMRGALNDLSDGANTDSDTDTGKARGTGTDPPGHDVAADGGGADP
jgi:hypothetical protein